MLQTLLELEREGWEALTTDGGAAYYRERLAPNALMAFPFGVMNRSDALAAMEAAKPWSTFEISEATAIELTTASGLLAYRVKATREGQGEFNAVVSSTYVRTNGDWKLAFHQQSFN